MDTVARRWTDRATPYVSRMLDIAEHRSGVKVVWAVCGEGKVVKAVGGQRRCASRRWQKYLLSSRHPIRPAPGNAPYAVPAGITPPYRQRMAEKQNARFR